MERVTLAHYFDHTLLKPAATREEVRTLCREAVEHGFFSVCVNPVQVATARTALSGTEVKVCSVVGFPLGAQTSAIKALETARAVLDGAEEIDMVINIGAMKEGAAAVVEEDIREVVKAAEGRTVKVILETCMLTKAEIVAACRLARNAGAHFVKTSTGFGGGGATVEDVALMKETVGDTMQVKASGGIKSLEDALRMIDAGADRLGASAGIAIMAELQAAG